MFTARPTTNLGVLTQYELLGYHQNSCAHALLSSLVGGHFPHLVVERQRFGRTPGQPFTAGDSLEPAWWKLFKQVGIGANRLRSASAGHQSANKSTEAGMLRSPTLTSQRVAIIPHDVA